ncbi:putative toxin-antitoxin system toxin component, PIN family [Iningainema tapete]|uniref:Putative toxin-antitoxin system toxin component, PIN family n=1 Tax=Iningainema tapete BLCC-T55 TaxID=2748662 RepID=A0A8J7CER5_9CYAN|nr:putative toxin-antitoxin system toxin component, PIN family [Iningainema tapete]MBD2773850.1 putative toxin-antitoxin system toxin component, PIN family [Iningainema tapete BLCC-T55]
MKVLVDTNIILDAFLEREPFVEDARTLLEAIRERRVYGYVTATTLTNIFYIVRRQTRSFELARQAISMTLLLMEVCAVDRLILEQAFASNRKDFEDAVQLACATIGSLDAIVTRDADGFAGASLPILSVTELLERLKETNE